MDNEDFNVDMIKDLLAYGNQFALKSGAQVRQENMLKFAQNGEKVTKQNLSREKANFNKIFEHLIDLRDASKDLLIQNDARLFKSLSINAQAGELIKFKNSQQSCKLIM